MHEKNGKSRRMLSGKEKERREKEDIDKRWKKEKRRKRGLKKEKIHKAKKRT